ncbi:MAG: rRNA maturation RNase YbeY [Candidatus Omnitrophica bacterium]|nr:rRNA maturation RNase YbeY [Candidatus Omnitrophota bacterium]
MGIMTVQITNAQREAPVSTARMTRLARRAVRRLGMREPGRLAITFIGQHRLRALNRRFLRRDLPTDVLSFRYDDEPIVGDILIAPAQARAYARRHGIPYAEELARYLVHGLLHWLGHLDSTPQQRRNMRQREDDLLAACGVLTSRDRRQGTGDKRTRKNPLSPVSRLLSQECD